MSPKQALSAVSKALLALAVWLRFAHSVAAQSNFKVLYSFTGGADGGGLYYGVVMDKQGKLYGTTSGGGAYNYGTVFELAPTKQGEWTETVLHSFMNGDPNGYDAVGNLIIDGVGNLYGVAESGGPYFGGTAFELTPGANGWSFSVLYDFCATAGDPCSPRSNLIMDRTGNFYGAEAGGANGGGAVFELTPDSGGWVGSLLYSFCSRPSCKDGSVLYAGVILDAAGNLYGTTAGGGDPSCIGGNGCGVVYELRRSGGSWSEAVLHAFTGAPNDSDGSSLLAFGSAGNLYGTGGGGSYICFGSSPCGTVYKMKRGANGHWHETVIYNFTGGADGNGPPDGVVVDQAGNLYGTTVYGGSASCGCGVVFKLMPGSGGKWTYSVLHTFVGSDGAQPIGGLILRNGKLYGTAVTGGSGGAGVVFELIP
jgi:uncharacterized repeat protein (TIGR03803 family)